MIIVKRVNLFFILYFYIAEEPPIPEPEPVQDTEEGDDDAEQSVRPPKKVAVSRQLVDLPPAKVIKMREDEVGTLTEIQRSCELYYNI